MLGARLNDIVQKLYRFRNPIDDGVHGCEGILRFSSFGTLFGYKFEIERRVLPGAGLKQGETKFVLRLNGVRQELYRLAQRRNSLWIAPDLGQRNTQLHLSNADGGAIVQHALK